MRGYFLALTTMTLSRSTRFFPLAAPQTSPPTNMIFVSAVAPLMSKEKWEASCAHGS